MLIDTITYLSNSITNILAKQKQNNKKVSTDVTDYFQKHLTLCLMKEFISEEYTFIISSVLIFFFIFCFLKSAVPIYSYKLSN